ncbi:MAG: hypothetical protein ACKUBY_04760 [Candidatus Moraniibacteriota bacterium]
MKKILTLMILTFTVFAIFQNVNAANTCAVEGGVPVNAGDPACYTTSVSRCSWSSVGTIGICRGGGYCGPSACTSGGSCASCSRGIQNPNYATCYTGGCGVWCTNVSEPIRITYTCYYLEVDTWSECDENGIQSATSVTRHSTSGTSCDNLNEDLQRNCGICDPTTDEQATGIAPEPEENLCIYGDPTPYPVTLNTSTNMWTWTCTGDAGGTTDVTCSAPNEEEAECNTTFTDADPLLTTAPTESDELCSGGTYEVGSLIGSSVEGPWSWNCLRIGNNPTHAESIVCNAQCFRPELIINPNPFPWPIDGSDATVNISVEPEGLCSNRYTCETDDSSETVPFNGTGTLGVDITQNTNSVTIPVTCTSSDPTIDDPKTTIGTTSGYCTARECNAQGSCQATPVPSDSTNNVACTSTCNSNADCSSGRLIETRP